MWCECGVSVVLLWCECDVGVVRVWCECHCTDYKTRTCGVSVV